MKLFFIPLLFVFIMTTAQTVTDKIPGTSCDNVVNNTLPADATDRSPSACESQFDWKVRTALRNAFSKALMNFPASDWEQSDVEVKPLKEVSKHSEQYFFNLSYYFKIDLAQQSPMYKEWYEKFQSQMEELKNPNANTTANFTDFNYRMNNSIHIKFYVLVNNVGPSIYFLKSGQQVFTVPGAAYAVKGPHAAALTGGDEQGSNACLVLFGKPTVSVNKGSNGATGVNVKNNFPKGVSRLTVQNISIRIECNDELLNKILKDVDFNAIASLIGK